MRLIVFALATFGCKGLNALQANGLQIAGVVTKPDTAVQRQAVADWARERGYPLFQPQRLRDVGLIEALSAMATDLIATMGFHARLPDEILRLPRAGAINVHSSLLPERRGPVPHKWAIVEGDAVSGVTVHRMVRTLDAGAILAQASFPIGATETGGSLFEKIGDVGAPLLAATAEAVQGGSTIAVEQDEALASYAGYPRGEDTRIDWTRPAHEIDRIVRGWHPSPRAWFDYQGVVQRIDRLTILPERSRLEAGTIRHDDAALIVATGSFDVRIEIL